ncbi:MAG TPA: HEAT repeat domain-containing protein [Planctomycetota bacterium]|nr:HEAT repeat domain-containing protein [Planctomycetota bacterium]
MSCLREDEILDLVEEGREDPHLRDCEACRARFDGIAPAVRLLRAAADAAEGADPARARALLRSAARRRPFAAPLAAAAVLLAAAGLATWVYFSTRPAAIRSTDNLSVDGAALAAGPAPGEAVLEDGTRLRLEAGSRVRLEGGGARLEAGAMEVHAVRPLRLGLPLGAARVEAGRYRLSCSPGETLGPDSPSAVVECRAGGAELSGPGGAISFGPGESAALVAAEPPVKAVVDGLPSRLGSLQAAALARRLPEELLGAHPELPGWLDGGEAEQMRALAAMTGVAHRDRLDARRLREETRVKGWAVSVAPAVAALARRPATPLVRRAALYGLRFLLIPREHAAELAALARPHLDDPDAAVRDEAVELLAHAGASAEALRARIDDPSPPVRLSAAKALRALKPAGLADLAEARAFAETDPLVRQVWFLALLDAGPDRAREAVLKALPGTELRMDACAAAARWSLREAVPVLRDVVRGGDPYAYYAVRALGEMGIAEAVPEIMALEGRPGFQPLAEWFLVAYGLLGDPRALPSVRKHLASPDPRLRDHALWASAAIDPEGTREPLRRTYSDAGRDDRLRRTCLYLLAEMGEPGLAGDLLKEADAGRGGRSPLGNDLGSSAFLFLVNRYRNPAAFAKLQAARLPERLEGPAREVLGRVASAAGLAVRVEGPDDRPGRVSIPGRISAARALSELSAGRGFLLEDAEIVQWSSAEARAKLLAWSLRQK